MASFRQAHRDGANTIQLDVLKSRDEASATRLTWVALAGPNRTASSTDCQSQPFSLLLSVFCKDFGLYCPQC
jgi:hypothetical protein